MDAIECIMSRRTIRRFKQDPLPRELLTTLVDAGRLASAAGNYQPWHFVVVATPEKVRAVFGTVAWLKGAGDPPEGAAPTAYIVVLGNPAIFKNYQSDCAAAIENIQLAGWALGVGSCWIGSVKRKELSSIIPVPEGFEIAAVVALGYPAERAELSGEPGTEVRRAQDGTLRVSKRDPSTIVTFV